MSICGVVRVATLLSVREFSDIVLEDLMEPLLELLVEAKAFFFEDYYCCKSCSFCLMAFASMSSSS